MSFATVTPEFQRDIDSAVSSTGPISSAARYAPPSSGGGFMPTGSASVDPATGKVNVRAAQGEAGGDDPTGSLVRMLSAAAPADNTASAPQAQARPSNVRAYMPVERYMPKQAAAPTVDPAAFASQVTSMRQVDPSASLGEAVDAHVAANTYAKNYLAALREAQGGYTGETGRITSMANANLSGANADLAGAHAELAGAQTGEAQARTSDTEAGTAIKRYSLEQQKSLQALTTKLQDPNLSAAERRNLEMQLWILHGKPPRPDNRFEVSRGAVDVMTGQRTPDIIVDRSTGETSPLDRGDAKAPPSDPQAEARAAVASGADRAKVNQRLRTMGQPELQ
jgi:hypothetical protein